ncbi:unnamed protein product [Closterium sp. NIES-54]
MKIASIIGAPHFLWPFAIRHAAHQLNLWHRSSHPQTILTGCSTILPHVASSALVTSPSTSLPASTPAFPTKVPWFPTSPLFLTESPSPSPTPPVAPLFPCLAPSCPGGAGSGGADAKGVGFGAADPGGVGTGGAVVRGKGFGDSARGDLDSGGAEAARRSEKT